MGFIFESMANLLLEMIDTIVFWVCKLGVSFNLNIGSDENYYFKTILPGVKDFADAIGILALVIVFLVMGLKLYQALLGPFASEAEGPGTTVLRAALAFVGVIASHDLFRWFQAGFNAVYSFFQVQYYKNVEEYLAVQLKPPTTATPAGQISEEAINRGKEVVTRTPAPQSSSSSVAKKNDAFKLFSSNNLVPKNDPDGLDMYGLAGLVFTTVLSFALLLTLLKTMFEIYERYVILAVLYYFGPLAFATLVSKNSSVFKNYMIMVGSQFVLMCSNLVFMGVFIDSWLKVIQNLNEGDAFPSSKMFLLTMFIWIAWLLTGQKLDEHLRSLGLSAAQSGQGIMGAIAGSMFLSRAALGGLKNLVTGGLSYGRQAAYGETPLQRGLRSENSPLAKRLNGGHSPSEMKQLKEQGKTGASQTGAGASTLEAANNLKDKTLEAQKAAGKEAAFNPVAGYNKNGDATTSRIYDNEGHRTGVEKSAGSDGQAIYTATTPEAQKTMDKIAAETPGMRVDTLNVQGKEMKAYSMPQGDQNLFEKTLQRTSAEARQAKSKSKGEDDGPKLLTP